MRNPVILLLLALGLFSVSHAQVTGLMSPADDMISWDEDVASPCGVPTLYRVDAGATVGGASYGTSPIVSAGFFGTGPSYTFDLAASGFYSLPADGTSTVFITLWHFSACGWRISQTTMVSSLVVDPVLVPPAIDGPTCASTISSFDVTFSWSPGDFTVARYLLELGTNLGGSDVGTTGMLSGSTTSAMLTIPPISETTLFVRLWYFVTPFGWSFVDCSYELDLPFDTLPDPEEPSLISPECGADTLSPGLVPFSWDAGDFTVLRWRVDVGSTPGRSNLGSTDILDGAITSGSIEIGTNTFSETAYIRLWYLSLENGAWDFEDCTVSYFVLLPE